MRNISSQLSTQLDWLREWRRRDLEGPTTLFLRTLYSISWKCRCGDHVFEINPSSRKILAIRSPRPTLIQTLHSYCGLSNIWNVCADVQYDKPSNTIKIWFLFQAGLWTYIWLLDCIKIHLEDEQNIQSFTSNGGLCLWFFLVQSWSRWQKGQWGFQTPEENQYDQ